MELLGWEVQAWEDECNRLGASVDYWRLTTDDARAKLRNLYSSIDS